MSDDQAFGAAESAKVEQLWGKVFTSSNRILLEHMKYGFDGVKDMPKPNVQEMLLQLKVFSFVFDLLMDGDMGYDDNRKLLNAKAQITNMERLALALEAENRKDYDAAVNDLERQAVF